MTAITALPQRVTLLDIIPRSRVRDVVAVFGFALATAGAAQISIPLGFTPVPITGQTFTVLLAGGALGANRGAISQFLYLFMGAVGLPFYADGTSGWDVATGSTAGYLFGFIVAAYLVGRLAEKGQDRRLGTSIPAILAGTVVIYAMGASWLAMGIEHPTHCRHRRAQRHCLRGRPVPSRRLHQSHPGRRSVSGGLASFKPVTA